eukprot:CAMPEP_0119281980 /NCGR_PEP_ID=MMETSP1329-20130426/25864_1 /TAXON_ID=114041 /ORGANISM="Genus nov. species nov., Strain RCC1024" /LENGTH=137 /DNA_ID=CAMNT_0007282619 /DNA_START=83 /DNA_END=492 /DNA_ORIENTATION=+
MPVLRRQDPGNRGPRVAPLVDELVEHAAVRVLRREGRAQHLQAHGRDVADDGRVVAVPPAAVEVDVRELLRQHAGLVLVDAAEEGAQHLEARVRLQQPRQRPRVHALEAVAAAAGREVRREPPHAAELERQGQPQLP